MMFKGVWWKVNVVGKGGCCGSDEGVVEGYGEFECEGEGDGEKLLLFSWIL